MFLTGQTRTPPPSALTPRDPGAVPDRAAAPSHPGMAALLKRHDRAGYVLGFGLGGFFDGILLHQILQWHHLLSAVEVGVLGDLRAQVMADGLFHAAMYVVALAGLWLLWRTRACLNASGAGRRLLANVAIGFGVWHVVDAVVSHWLTGLHRIRMDVAEPLPWDIGWLVVFGIVPLLLGWHLRRGSGGGRPGARVAGLVGAATLTGALLNAFPVAANEGGTITVVMRPGAGASELLAALEAPDARILWSDPGGGVWMVRPTQPVDALHFYRHGAMYVSGTLAPAGCADWFTLDARR